MPSVRGQRQSWKIYIWCRSSQACGQWQRFSLGCLWWQSVAVLGKVVRLEAEEGKLIAANWDFAWIFSRICHQGKQRQQQPERHGENSWSFFIHWIVHKLARLASSTEGGVAADHVLLWNNVFHVSLRTVLLLSSIVALFSVDVDVFKSMLDLPQHGFTLLYALDISEVSLDVLKVRQ